MLACTSNSMIDFKQMFEMEIANFTMEEFKDEPIEPKTFQEAYNHPEEEQRVKWRTAIKKEFHKMIERGVWRKIKKADMPDGKRCVKHKWVFNIKRNGV